MKIATTTIIVHSDIENEYFNETLDSLINQTSNDFDVVFLGEIDGKTGEKMSENNISFQWIVKNEKAYSEMMNEAMKQTDPENFLYIDNRESPVILKESALEAFMLTAEKNPGAGLFYSDYELESEGKTKEVHLLFHHIGRVRDNQDYGKVFFIKREAIESIGGFDNRFKFNNLYDVRLKISELFNLIRISNKYSGSFYTVKSGGKKANVFDYLMSGKEVQLEAEDIVTKHLKRINAHMPKKVFFESDNKFKNKYDLEATVIIPVGNRPEFISTAIDSIQAQTVKDIEAIIVVNGGKNDPTSVEVRKYMEGGELYDPNKPEIRLIVIDINNIGLCLNIGAKNARGKYYVQLDSDDRLKPDAVEKVLEVFKSDKKIGMVIGSYEVWEKLEDGTMNRMDEIPVVTHDEWTDKNGRNNLLRINGAGAPRCIPIDVIKEIGYFSINDDEFAQNYGEDYEMVLKISDYYKIGRVYDAIYDVVRHSGGTDHSISEEVVMRNDEAKDDVRKLAILRRIGFNNSKKNKLIENLEDYEITIMHDFLGGDLDINSKIKNKNKMKDKKKKDKKKKEEEKKDKKKKVEKKNKKDKKCCKNKKKDKKDKKEKKVKKDKKAKKAKSAKKSKKKKK